MKKSIPASILACLAIILVYATAFAEPDEVLIKPYDWDNRTAYSDQYIILNARWGSCRKGAVQDFLTATNISWTLKKDGVLMAAGEDTNRFWGPLDQIIAPTGACMGNTPESIPVTYWRYPVGYLQPGDYHFTSFGGSTIQ